MNARDRDLQYQTALTQAEQQKALEMQQADAELQAFQASLSQNDFEAPDKSRVGLWLKNQEKALASRLKDEYQGEIARFFRVEGASWMQNTMANLQKSPEYLRAVRNRAQVASHQKAINDGKHLIGRVVTDKSGKQRYITADSDLMAYFDGREGFEDYIFKGAYKDEEDGVYDHFSKTTAPGQFSWQKVKVAPSEIQNLLRSKYSPEIADDIYFRKYQNPNLYYKQMPYEDYVKYQQGQAEYQMDMRLKNQQYNENAFDLGKKQRDDRAEQAERSQTPGNFLLSQLQHAQEGPALDVRRAGNRQLPYSKVDWNEMVAKGSRLALNKVAPYGVEKLIDQHLDLREAKGKGETGYAHHNIKEGFTEAGALPLNLGGIRFKVVDRDNAMYFPQKSLDQNGFPKRGKSGDGPTAMARVRIELDDTEAAKLGLENAPWLWFNSSTEKGTGVYNKDGFFGGGSMWIYTPLSNVADPNLQYGLQSAVQGTAAANNAIGVGRSKK
ncbi:hypothetical protein GCM10027299_42160 [Larkinella ripae]